MTEGRDPVGQLEALRKLYRGWLEEHGVGSASVGWRDDMRHRLKFSKLVELIDTPSGEPVSVNDFGCGYGALFEYLFERGIPVARYTGYDVSVEMLQAARARIADPRATFVESTSVTEEADYSFACGTFFVKFDTPEEEWARWVKGALRNLAASSRKGFAFNLLSTYVEYRQPDLYYGDPLEYVDFCVRELSRNVTLHHHYPPLWEWTMLVRSGTPHGS